MEHDTDDRAHLVSHPFKGDQQKEGNACVMTIWYFLYGGNVGTLAVYIM